MKLNDEIRGRVKGVRQAINDSDKILCAYIGIASLPNEEDSYSDGVYIIGSRYIGPIYITYRENSGSEVTFEDKLDPFLDYQLAYNRVLLSVYVNDDGTVSSKTEDKIREHWYVDLVEPEEVLETVITWVLEDSISDRGE